LVVAAVTALGLAFVFPAGVPVCLPPAVWCETAGVASSIPFWIPMLGMDLLLAWIAIHDLWTLRVPNWVT
jgi:hypothetical protein